MRSAVASTSAQLRNSVISKALASLSFLAFTSSACSCRAERSDCCNEYSAAMLSLESASESTVVPYLFCWKQPCWSLSCFCSHRCIHITTYCRWNNTMQRDYNFACSACAYCTEGWSLDATGPKNTSPLPIWNNATQRYYHVVAGYWNVLNGSCPLYSWWSRFEARVTASM